MSLANQISLFVEQLPERNQIILLELVKAMISPDDLLSDEDIADIEQARAEYARGESVPHNAINWN